LEKLPDVNGACEMPARRPSTQSKNGIWTLRPKRIGKVWRQMGEPTVWFASERGIQDREFATKSKIFLCLFPASCCYGIKVEVTIHTTVIKVRKIK
jgi:hypothetical protein